MITTEQDVRAVIEAMPELCDNGIRPSPGHPVRREFRMDAVLAAAGWLTANLPAIKSAYPGKSPGSYGLKHVYENATGGQYVTNGEFILAAVAAGYPIHPYPESPNVAIGVSRRALNRVWVRVFRGGREGLSA